MEHNDILVTSTKLLDTTLDVDGPYRLVIGNTAERVVTLKKMLQYILDRKTLRPALAASVRGRLRYAAP